MAFNRITIMGRLTSAPSTSQTKGGTSVTKFNLAVDRGFGEDKKTDFIPVVFFGKTAETVAKYVDKGHQLLVSGQLQTDSYEDKDGNKRTSFNVFATDFSFCEGKRESSTNSSSKKEKPAQAEFSSLKPIEDGEDDFPF